MRTQKNEKELKSKPAKNWLLYVEKGQIVLEFNDYNGLHKSETSINNFIKEIKKEITRASKALKYIEELKKQPDLFNQLN